MTNPSSRGSVTSLAVYVSFGFACALGRVFHGDGSLLAVAVYAILGLAIVGCRVMKSWAGLADWLPLLALPALYAMLPATALPVGPFDAPVQRLDRWLFGSDVARSFAAAWPYRPLSEVLHAAYLSYYAMIYGPPLVMYSSGNRAAFRQVVLSFTLAMTGCFMVYWVFPVLGPRYVWPSGAGMPDGMFRRLALFVLEAGSSRGTAFPSSHFAIALTMALSCIGLSRRAGVVLLVMSILLGFGAVYGGFHYGSDILAGGLVAVSSWWLARRVERRGLSKPGRVNS